MNCQKKLANRSLKLERLKKDLKAVVKDHLQNDFYSMKIEKENEFCLNQTKISNTDVNEVKCFHDFYEELDIIGQGGNAVVKRALDRRTQEIVAVKIIRSDEPEIIRTVKKDFEIVMSLNHVGVIKAKELFVDEYLGKMFYVMEYVEGRTLKHELRKRVNFSEKEAGLLIKEIVDIVIYIQQNGVCHRDINPKNIMICSNGELKLLDFGIATRFFTSIYRKGEDITTKVKLYTCTGTLAYCAPEMLKGEGYIETVDAWSVGVMAYEMLYGYRPFEYEYISDTIDAITQGKLLFDDSSIKLSRLAKDFVKRFLLPDSKYRLTCQDAILHPWLERCIINQAFVESPLSVREKSMKSIRKKSLATIKFEKVSFSAEIEESSKNLDVKRRNHTRIQPNIESLQDLPDTQSTPQTLLELWKTRPISSSKKNSKLSIHVQTIGSMTSINMEGREKIKSFRSPPKSAAGHIQLASPKLREVIKRSRTKQTSDSETSNSGLSVEFTPQPNIKSETELIGLIEQYNKVNEHPDSIKKSSELFVDGD